MKDLRYIMKVSIFFMVVLMSGIYCFSQKKFILKSQESLCGFIMVESDSSYTLLTEKMDTVRVLKNEIVSENDLRTDITLTNGEDINFHVDSVVGGVFYVTRFSGEVNSIKKENIQQFDISDYDLSQYSLLGFVLNSPSQFNFLLGYQLQPGINIKIKVGTDIEDEVAMQFNIGYNIIRTRAVEFNLSGGIGFGNNQYDNVRMYGGVFADFNILGGYFDCGVIYREYAWHPDYMFSFGFVYRLIFNTENGNESREWEKIEEF